ncbi:MAG TPA: hypothetical protein VFQ61_25490, partial [Polyangiaceae bacterium]|nr:hypothetical protein [Polyangiaceae bacterium]
MVPPNDDQAPYLLVHAARRYFIGLPLVFNVVFENRSAIAHFLRLPRLDLLTRQANQFAVTLERIDKSEPARYVRFPPVEEDGPVAQLGPMERLSVICDLSNLAVTFTPGIYRITFSVGRGPTERSSAPIEVALEALAPTDARVVGRLLQPNPRGRADIGAWASFLEHHSRPIGLPLSLSQDVRKQLALHLFLSAAVHGRAPISELDADALGAITDRAWLSEA